MTVDELLDAILIPRSNGSQGLEQVASFIGRSLEQAGAAVSRHEFTATPWGFQLVWTVVLVLMIGYVVAIATRRYGIALSVMLLTAALLLLEFELLYSPISGLLPLEESNVVGSFPGDSGGPTLIFSAHYDTTTHFGDHFSWGRWGYRQGPATAAAIALAAAGLWRKKAGKDLPRAIALPIALLVPIPFAAMFWFQSIGPLVRTPSPGALDNGGSVAALLHLGSQLGARSAARATTVELVFFAAEEERTLGSWAFAQELDRNGPVAVINLESVGASEDLAYIEEDGFAMTRYHSPAGLVRLVNESAEALWGRALPARKLPAGTLTDGRSFLAHGIPAITLRAFIDDEFPRDLHSEHDSRSRLKIAGIERGARLLRAIVDAVDHDPAVLAAIAKPASR
jgi:acetylornithine deacetylase/succinyl-diaminopimelate desuccinylase-like protein